VLKDKYLIGPRILVIGLIFSVSALACLVGKASADESTSSSPIYSCLNHQGDPFLLRADVRAEKLWSSKSEESTANNYSEVNFSRTDGSFPLPVRPLGRGFFPSTIPIYQIKNAYLI
jgi:hypothetical protein